MLNVDLFTLHVDIIILHFACRNNLWKNNLHTEGRNRPPSNHLSLPVLMRGVWGCYRCHMPRLEKVNRRCWRQILVGETLTELNKACTNV